MRTLALLAVLGWGLTLSAHAGAETPAYEVTPEQFVALPPTEVLQRAKDYALKHREAPAAARAGLDWYVSATALQHGEEQKSARLYLLLEHPRTTAGAFIYHSLANDGQLAELLLEEFNREDRNLDSPFLTRYVLAMMMAPQRFSSAAKDNANFMLSFSYALQAVGYDKEHPLVKSVQEALRKRDVDGKSARMLNILLGKQRTAEKFTQLQEFKDNATARAMQRGLFLKLQIQERVRPAEIRLHLENLLTGHKWKEALPWFEKIPAEGRDPQLRFWQGWALAATGETRQAIELLEGLAHDAPQDPWGKLAAESLPNIRDEVSRLEEAAKLVSAGLEQCKQQPPEVFEARIVLLDKDGETVLADGYLGLDATRSQFEVLLQRDGQPFAAYRTRGGRGAIFAAGKSEISTFARGGVIPTPRATIQEGSDGQYRFNFAMGVNDKLSGNLQALFESLLQSSVLASEQSIFQWLKHNRTHGMFLAPPQAGEKPQLVWTGCEPNEPRVKRFVVQFGEQGRVVALHAKTMRIESIRYGAAADLSLAPPAWPNLPERHTEELPTGELFSLAGAAVQMMTDASRTSQREALDNRRKR